MVDKSETTVFNDKSETTATVLKCELESNEFEIYTSLKYIF